MYGQIMGLGEDSAARHCPFFMLAPLTACWWMCFPKESLFFPAQLAPGAVNRFLLLYQNWQKFPCVNPSVCIGARRV